MEKERHSIRKANSTACIMISFNIYMFWTYIYFGHICFGHIYMFQTYIFCERTYTKVLRIYTKNIISSCRNMNFL